MRSSSVSPPTSTVGTAGRSLRPVKYKNWTESKLYKAFEAFQEGMSIHRASESHGVPCSTLQDRVSDDEEEEELVQFILGCAAMCYAKSKQEIIAIIRNVVAAKDKDVFLQQVT